MFPATRLRRLRSHPRLRDIVRETELTPADLMLPLFVRPGQNIRKPILSMPGQAQLSIDQLLIEARAAAAAGIPGIMLFGIPEAKDAIGSGAWSPDGIVQRSLRELRDAGLNLLLTVDLCFCEFTDHGHCGVLQTTAQGQDVDNDRTLENLVKQAISLAEAGANLIAPSGMMDGMIQALRRGLDGAGFSQLPIMSYAAKYASGFYGPFREAAESTPQFGDRRTYQMDPANGREALREVAEDVAEGADLIMVKPALSYLDVIARVRQAHPEVPLAAYNVSGEYAMLKAAAANGWLDERRTVLEVLTSIKRAGADLILTYHALDACRWLTT